MLSLDARKPQTNRDQLSLSGTNKRRDLRTHVHMEDILLLANLAGACERPLINVAQR